MDAVYAQVVESIYSRAIIHDKPRFLVAIAGAPGSGKTTLANALTERLNAMPASIRRHTVCVPMDGFHLSRAELDQLPNREEAYVRRGAPWTFDVSGFITFVQRLRKWAEKDTSPFHNQTTPPPSPSSSEILYAPSFDHEKKDPVTDGISITPDTSIIILEVAGRGIYGRLSRFEYQIPTSILLIRKASVPAVPLLPRLNKEINDLEVSYEDLGRDNILWNEELGSNADNEMPLLLSLGTGNIWPGQTSTATKRVAVTPGNGCRRRQNHNSVGITKCIALMEQPLHD
ncbi:P-loop containing nucleoside triphosphate hydrolase protein [Aspergillus flavus]|uniref:P-loop containing nucleoside triphosphate hydrolase protein n=1 Tax=Aspergillus flavus TaxID=5059 RepID=A0A5N6H4T6_ASPFL|nr:P-loop containing nucleoside triphosphate hydrolase protein [Aspergillus flavus]